MLSTIGLEDQEFEAKIADACSASTACGPCVAKNKQPIWRLHHQMPTEMLAPNKSSWQVQQAMRMQQMQVAWSGQKITRLLIHGKPGDTTVMKNLPTMLHACPIQRIRSTVNLWSSLNAGLTPAAVHWYAHLASQIGRGDSAGWSQSPKWAGFPLCSGSGAQSLGPGWLCQAQESTLHSCSSHDRLR